ncbi:MAG: hypothetical protein PUF62_02440 [Bacteroidales bacterium]|nr:hypothetical protein [Bacteroidales bacterium]
MGCFRSPTPPGVPRTKDAHGQIYPVVRSINNSPENVYIQKAFLNGARNAIDAISCTKTFIPESCSRWRWTAGLCMGAKDNRQAEGFLSRRRIDTCEDA